MLFHTPSLTIFELVIAKLKHIFDNINTNKITNLKLAKGFEVMKLNFKKIRSTDIIK